MYHSAYKQGDYLSLDPQHRMIGSTCEFSAMQKLNFTYFCKKYKNKEKIRCALTSHHMLITRKVGNSGHL